MKSYKVWIELEEYDSKTDEHTSMEGMLDYANTAEVGSLKEAVAIADTLNEIGKSALFEALVEARMTLDGDSNDAEHDALVALLDTLGVLGKKAGAI